MFYQKFHTHEFPPGYDLPFTPRYNVPESFRRALSYEGQQHWFLDLFQDLYFRSETLSSFLFGYTDAKYTSAQAKAFIDTHVEFTVQDYSAPSGKLTDVHNELPECLKDGDTVAVRFYDSTNSEFDIAIGILVDACRCNEVERWTVHVLYVVYDVSGRISNLESKVTKIEGDIVDIKGDITEIKGDITSIKGDINNIKGDISNIKNTINNMGNNVADLTDRVAALEKNVDYLLNRCPEYVIRRYNPARLGGMQLYNTGRMRFWFNIGRLISDKTDTDLEFSIKMPFPTSYIHNVVTYTEGTYGDCISYMGPYNADGSYAKMREFADHFIIKMYNPQTVPGGAYYTATVTMDAAFIVESDGSTVDERVAKGLARVDGVLANIDTWWETGNFYDYPDPEDV